MSCDNRPAAGAAGAACGLRRPKRVSVLGCTGSIGLQTLDVARRHPESVRIVALAAHSKVEGVAAAAAEGFRAYGRGQRALRSPSALLRALLSDVTIGKL